MVPPIVEQRPLNDIRKSILSKLDADELAWLEDLAGVRLDDPDAIDAIRELHRAHAQLRRLQQLRLRTESTISQCQPCSVCGHEDLGADLLYVGSEGAVCLWCTDESVKALAARGRKDA